MQKAVGLVFRNGVQFVEPLVERIVEAVYLELQLGKGCSPALDYDSSQRASGPVSRRCRGKAFHRSESCTQHGDPDRTSNPWHFRALRIQSTSMDRAAGRGRKQGWFGSPDPLLIQSEIREAR
jgi:hypothetical protein